MKKMCIPMRQASFRSLILLVGMVICSSAGTSQDLKRDLPYGSSPQQRLDLTIPSGKGFPTVIFIHGGSLTTGDKADKDYGNVCAPFVAAGIACANVNYRLAPERWPAQAEDAASAVAWVRTNIRSRGGDPRKLFLFGHSSGATLAALVGTDERYLARHGLKTSDLRGVIPMGSIMWDDDMEQTLAKYGRERVEQSFLRDPGNKIYGSLNEYLDRWPIRHVRAGLPPFLFLIAESEQENPPVLKTNRKFVEDARALGNHAEYKVLPGRTHYSAIRKFSEPDDPTFAIVRDFIQRFGGDGRQ